MVETSARLLRLLSLLQSRRDWTGAELAGRLGVTGRTVRTDVERLRALGYPVLGTRGAVGGYRLGAGASLPPLLLDDEEAVAVTVGLHTAAGGAIAGIEEASLRALAKLEQVLPARLRRRVSTLQAYTVPVPRDAGGPVVDPGLLSTLAAACRDREGLRFDYDDHAGTGSRRDVEPYRLVTWGRRWYLLAYDLGRDDWRTFRVDRIRPRTPTGPRFPPRAIPGDDAAAFVAAKVAGMWPYQATIRLHVPADSEPARQCASYGRIEPLDERHCRLHLGAEDPRGLAFLLGALEVDFDVDPDSDLAEHLRRTAARFSHAAGQPPSATTSTVERAP
jgi:predicted DNA-binding transcriptional regulator YafY